MPRRDISMSAAEVAAFLEQGRILQVASLHPDGRPHLVPMWYVVEEGRVVFRSFSRSQKIRNLQRDPRLTALVERGEAYTELQGVMIQGRARLVEDPAYVLTLYGRLAAKYAMVGGAPRSLSTEELAAAFGRHAAKNTAVVVEADQVASWDHTKLGGEY
ncbi:MAG: TIGR03618 family F420-dependent PPOX class oxidoreductase [Acidimicrobiia bacterium]|jgi:PPOX class probable F420-dependent enzyme|nr:TIGR03618 family F420-dependent PPOX class oxidoreductase [Acidimicrobiia bacterium]